MTGHPSSSPSRRDKVIAGIVGIASTILIAVAVLGHYYWPFSENVIRQDLASAASANVKFGAFHSTFFPPGCVAENVAFTRKGSSSPFITAKRITISSYPVALLRGHVGTFRAEGLHATIARDEFSQNQVRKQTTIDEFVADDAVLEVSSKDSDAPLQFVFHRFVMGNLNGNGTTSFAAQFENPLPPGTIETTGNFGPWNKQNPGATPISARYSLAQADLGAFHSIGGTLSSTGTIKGTIKALAVQGSTHMPELVVAKTHHGERLDTDFDAVVDATKGDVELKSVTAHFGKDVITASGSIARRDDGHRSAILELACDKGRIEDSFYPFIRSPRSPLAGDVRFHMHIVLPSGHERFLRRVQINSTFEIENARFTNPETEARISRVASPPSKNETETLANFEGTVTLKNGVAQFSNLSVKDQGAAALFAGKFDLTDEKVDLHGKLKTEASLSKTTSGIKAVFAKAIEPFFKKKPHETVVPVHVGGTYSHPSFGLDLGS